MLKKIIISSSLLLSLGGLILFNFSNFNNSNNNVKADDYNFKNLSGYKITGMSYNSKGDLALSIIINGGGTTNSGLVIGTLNQETDTYSFQPISYSIIPNNSAAAVAWSPDGDDVAVATYNSGLWVGHSDGNGGYTFKNTVAGNPRQRSEYLGSRRGQGVSFDTDGDLFYASATDSFGDGGLTVLANNGENSGTYVRSFYYDNTEIKISDTANDIQNISAGADKEVVISSFTRGLTVGLFGSSSTGYTFTSYETTNTPQIGSNNGRSVAISSATGARSDGDIAYASNGGSLSIGVPNTSGVYSFTSYNSTNTNDGITSAEGQGAAWSSDGEQVGYASLNDGALSIGTYNSSTNRYVFRNYTKANDGLVGDNGRAVAFGPKNLVSYAGYNETNIASDAGISYAFPGLSLNISQDISYALSESNRIDLSFDFQVSYALNQITQGDYVRMAVSSSDGTNIIGIYYTSDGEVPSGAEISNSSAVQTTSDREYSVTNLGASSGVFAQNTRYTITFAYGSSESDLTTIATRAITTPSDPSSLTADFESNQNAYTLAEDRRNLYINSLSFSFNKPLLTLISDYYVKVLISSGNNVLDGYYITLNGNIPDGESIYPTPNNELRFTGSTNYTIDDIENSGIGYTPGATYNFSILVGNSSSSLITLVSQNFVVPNNLPANSGTKTTGELTIGLGIGLGVGVPILAGTALGGLFVYRVYRKRRNLLG